MPSKAPASAPTSSVSLTVCPSLRDALSSPRAPSVPNASSESLLDTALTEVPAGAWASGVGVCVTHAFSRLFSPAGRDSRCNCRRESTGFAADTVAKALALGVLADAEAASARADLTPCFRAGLREEIAGPPASRERCGSWATSSAARSRFSALARVWRSLSEDGKRVLNAPCAVPDPAGPAPPAAGPALTAPTAAFDNECSAILPPPVIVRAPVARNTGWAGVFAGAATASAGAAPIAELSARIRLSCVCAVCYAKGGPGSHSVSRVSGYVCEQARSARPGRVCASTARTCQAGEVSR